jgi:3-oxoacyl-[acyl-carrier-protein] synthase-1
METACREIGESVLAAKEHYGAHRVAVVIGSTDNGSEQSLRAHQAYARDGRFPEGYRLEDQQAHLPAEFIRRFFGLDSLAMAVSTACTSSAGALVHARNLLESGMADAVIAGGADIVSESVLKGFISLEAVDRNPCLPFSRNRRGINLGEGAALFLLSRESSGPEGLYLAGCGEASDAHHATAPDPEGKGAAAAMKEALKDAGLEGVDYINLHGTGTALNDAMEAGATRRVFSDPPAASSTKAMTGHTLGAAGAMELGICWLLLSHRNPTRLLPPHIWDGEPDPAAEGMVFVEPGQSLERLSSCMSNSYAFGGSNVSLIVAKESQ